MVKLAQVNGRVIVTVEELDRHPDLLVVANGTVDLRTGEFRASKRDDLITKGSGVRYEPSARSPNWHEFLERVLPDPEVREFLQVAFGYSLTGEVTEEKLFFCYGDGANGKSVVGEVLGRLAGGYATPMVEGFLTSAKQEPWAIADLQGRRVVFSNETGRDGTLNEQRVKEITSYHQLRAAFKYGKHFTFDPTHKLWVRGNYQPTIVGTDNGIWRRIALILFEITIPERERNPKFIEQFLVPELPGILAWAVRGAVKWYESGLPNPPSLRSAIKQYRQNEDILEKFLDDCCEVGPGFSATSKKLGQALASWSTDEGVCPPPSQKALANKLRKIGVERQPSNGVTWWHGVGLREQTEITGELAGTSAWNRPSAQPQGSWDSGVSEARSHSLHTTIPTRKSSQGSLLSPLSPLPHPAFLLGRRPQHSQSRCSIARSNRSGYVRHHDGQGHALAIFEPGPMDDFN
jgi:putative DNA primase/helicase